MISKNFSLPRSWCLFQCAWCVCHHHQQHVQHARTGTLRRQRHRQGWEFEKIWKKLWKKMKKEIENKRFFFFAKPCLSDRPRNRLRSTSDENHEPSALGNASPPVHKPGGQPTTTTTQPPVPSTSTTNAWGINARNANATSPVKVWEFSHFLFSFWKMLFFFQN